MSWQFQHFQLNWFWNVRLKNTKCTKWLKITYSKVFPHLYVNLSVFANCFLIVLSKMLRKWLIHTKFWLFSFNKDLKKRWIVKVLLELSILNCKTRIVSAWTCASSGWGSDRPWRSSGSLTLWLWINRGESGLANLELQWVIWRRLKPTAISSYS